MKHTLVDKIIYLLGIFVMFSFCLTGTAGTFTSMVGVLLLFSFSLLQRVKFKFFFPCKMFVFLLCFALFCFLSNIWARDNKLSWEASTSILRMWIVLELVFCSISRQQIPQLFNMIIWGSTLFIIYIISTVGINEIILLSHMEERLVGDNFNANMVGLLGSVLIVVCYSLFLYHGFSLKLLASLLGFLIVFLTSSRKAFVVLFIGVFLVYVQKRKIDNIPLFLLKLILVVIVFCGIVYFLFSTSAFSLYAERFNELSAFILDTGDITHSDWERKVMIEAGLNQFYETPFTGIGIDNGKIIAESLTGNSFYLHNNYVELLADVGIFGFMSFYAIYLYFGVRMYKLHSYWNEYSKLAITLLVMFLIADYGRVSYYYKDVMFVLIVCYRVLEDTEKRALLTGKSIL